MKSTVFCYIIIIKIKNAPNAESRRNTMDNIKELVDKLVDKIQSSKDIKELFEENPIKAVEKVLGVDLPDDIVEKVIDAVKAKISIDDVSDKVSDVVGMFKKLF